jgi:hypothetical protein
MMSRLHQLKEHLHSLPGFVGSSDVFGGDGGSGGGGSDGLSGAIAFSSLALFTTFRSLPYPSKVR